MVLFRSIDQADDVLTLKRELPGRIGERTILLDQPARHLGRLRRLPMGGLKQAFERHGCPALERVA